MEQKPSFKWLLIAADFTICFLLLFFALRWFGILRPALDVQYLDITVINRTYAHQFTENFYVDDPAILAEFSQHLDYENMKSIGNVKSLFERIIKIKINDHQTIFLAGELVFNESYVWVMDQRVRDSTLFQALAAPSFLVFMEDLIAEQP